MNDNEYSALLDRAFSKLPSLAAEHSDFVIPSVDSIVQGAKTVIRNISAIADKARRNVSDISRYLSKELGVPVSIEGQRMIINGRFSYKDLDAKIANYFNTYVICKECHKSDTKVADTQRGYIVIVCEACGAIYTVKNYQ